MIYRVIAAIDPVWNVTVTLGNGTVLPSRQLTKATFPAPPQPDLPSHLPWSSNTPAPASAEVRALAERCQRLAQRRRSPGEAQNDFDVVAVGRHLFDTLLGPDWGQILNLPSGVSVIELALQWSAEDAHLHRLPWECLHAPTGFLAQGVTAANGTLVRVCCSRVVAAAPIPSRQSDPAPRILFVIGSSLDDPRVRAGAEIFGLLRQLKLVRQGVGPKRRRYWPIRVLQSAKASSLQSAVREFQPEVVHIISHGRVNAGAPPSILLQPELDEQGEQWKDPAVLAQLLTVDQPGHPHHGRKPFAVILSACFTGTSATADSSVGGTAQAPLAAQLVAAGIPVVIGMGGRVADQACRLFTRTFCEGLVNGAPLVAAMERGRRAAFLLGDWPLKNIDWAFPTYFRAPEITAQFSLSPSNPHLQETWLKRVYEGLRLDREEPVYVARLELLDTTFQQLAEAAPGLLLVSGHKGSGKSRLLREFTAQAAAQGHLPLLLARDSNDDFAAYRSQAAVCETWMKALGQLCKAFGLPLPNPFALHQMQSVLAGSEPPEKLPVPVQNALITNPKGLNPILKALEADLRTCLTTAQAMFPERHPAGSKPWVLFDQLQLYPLDLQPGFFETNETPFTASGLSDDPATPLPVVLAFDPGPKESQGLKALDEGKYDTLMKPLKLSSFGQGEDVRYWRRVLLHPHDSKLAEYRSTSISGQPWILDEVLPGDARIEDFEECVYAARKSMSGQPIDFASEALYVNMLAFKRSSLARVADDDDKLKELAP